MTDPISHARMYAASAMVSGALVFFVCLIIIMGPILEARYLPVVTNVEVYETPASRDGLTALIVIGNKVRDCELEEVSALSMSSDTGIFEKSFIAFLVNKGRPEQLSNRPMGRQSFGVMEFDPGGKTIRVTARHRCHPLWLTTKELFTWQR